MADSQKKIDWIGFFTCGPRKRSEKCVRYLCAMLSPQISQYSWLFMSTMVSGGGPVITRVGSCLKHCFVQTIFWREGEWEGGRGERGGRERERFLCTLSCNNFFTLAQSHFSVHEFYAKHPLMAQLCFSPNCYAMTENQTRIRSVAPPCRTLIQVALPTELPRPHLFLIFHQII